MSYENKIKKRYNRVAPIYDFLEYFMEKGKMGDWSICGARTSC